MRSLFLFFCHCHKEPKSLGRNMLPPTFRHTTPRFGLTIAQVDDYYYNRHSEGKARRNPVSGTR
ncbi:MAG TPA: hypothetical protein PK325_13750 [Cyclobacteriaceae bacterium]|nr:hypothetical protein [Cyclobacteriaceae bacterium]HMV10857.1 hypothetical protein [Cyclobacteriaceae bacterium]HMV91712.1 hypothetical protein [Cyclobacteriaceae bacterium]HMW99702.1 hypothetical protein [Cyclobacteriaceae bacterium]HMX51980.1 hypothetical protein [Cyclobacteriaceae bacterium]